MAGWTNRGKKLALDHLFNGLALPTNWILYLTKGVPTDTTNLFSDLVEADNCSEITLDGTDFDAPTENDGTHIGSCLMADQAFTAGGGAIVCKAAVLTDDVLIEANRNVYCYWNLAAGADVTVTVGQTLTLVDLDLRLTET